MVIGLDTTYKALDDYAHAYTQYNSSRKTFVNGLYLASIGLAGCLLTFVFLMFASGHPALGDRSVVLYPFDKIKTDLMLLLMAFAAYISAAFLAPLASKLLHLLVTEGYWDRASRLMMFGSLYMVGILTFFSLVRRYKAESLWTNSLLHDLTETLSESTFKYRLTLSFALYLGGQCVYDHPGGILPHPERWERVYLCSLPGRSLLLGGGQSGRILFPVPQRSPDR